MASGPKVKLMLMAVLPAKAVALLTSAPAAVAGKRIPMLGSLGRCFWSQRAKRKEPVKKDV